jgi:endonuclease I
LRQGRTQRFRAASGKGAAARAVFYFLVRYPDAISVTELPRDRLGVLLAWHQQDRTNHRLVKWGTVV